MLHKGLILACCFSLISAWGTISHAGNPNQVRQVSHHAGCGCEHQASPVPVHGGECCSTCAPRHGLCCPPLIPALLHGVDRLLKRVFCCSACGVRCILVGGRNAPTCGCDAPVMSGPGHFDGEIIEHHGAYVPNDYVPNGQGYVPSGNQHYAPVQQRPVPKRGVRETQLEVQSVIKRTSYAAPQPRQLRPADARQIPQVQRVPTSEQSRKPLQLKRPVSAKIKDASRLDNPLRD
jgi:hypothetical protein